MSPFFKPHLSLRSTEFQYFIVRADGLMAIYQAVFPDPTLARLTVRSLEWAKWLTACTDESQYSTFFPVLRSHH